MLLLILSSSWQREIKDGSAKEMIKIATIAISILIAHGASADDDRVVFETLLKVASMGQVVTTELSALSTNQVIPETVRFAAKDALRTHDRSATNSFQTLDMFIRGWTITNEPPRNAETIALMKRTMELGYSATRQLEAFVADTNRPPQIRNWATRFLTTTRSPAGDVIKAPPAK